MYPEEFTADSSSLLRDEWEIKTAGEAGNGCEVVSWRKCTKESSGSELSELLVKSPKGSLPVDENKEIVPGCIDVENMADTSRYEPG